MKKELNLTKKMDLGQIFEWSFKLFGQNFLYFTKIVSFFIIAILLLLVLTFPSLKNFMSFYAEFAAGASTGDFGNPEEIFSKFIPMAVSGFGYSLATSIIYLLAVAAIIKGISVKLDGTHETELDVVKFSLSKIIPVLFTALICVIFLGLSIPLFLLCGTGLILFIFLLTKMIFIINVIILEGQNYFSAISRSFELTKKNFWPTLGLIVIFYMLNYFAMMIVVTPLYITLYVPLFKKIVETEGMIEPEMMMADYLQNLPMVALYIFSIATIIIQFIFIITFLIALTLKFYNIRNLREGQELLNRIDEQITSGQPDNPFPTDGQVESEQS